MQAWANANQSEAHFEMNERQLPGPLIAPANDCFGAQSCRFETGLFALPMTSGRMRRKLARHGLYEIPIAFSSNDLYTAVK